MHSSRLAAATAVDAASACRQTSVSSAGVSLFNAGMAGING
ncbi:MAG: hypothetical protein V7L01_10810 [Nostoc sp.]